MTNRFTPEVREAERKAFCRACDGVIEKGKPMVSFYSIRSRGQYIHLHTTCAKKIGELVNDADDT